MILKKLKILGNLVEWFKFYQKESRRYRFKIIGIENNKPQDEILLLVLIHGVKKQIVQYNPKEIVLDNELLNEFSAFDARAITFYAMKKHISSIIPTYSIIRQEFSDGKTTYTLNENYKNTLIKLTAKELYSGSNLSLDNFNHEDFKNILTTAIQEQTIEDMKD